MNLQSFPSPPTHPAYVSPSQSKKMEGKQVQKQEGDASLVLAISVLKESGRFFFSQS